MSTFLLVYDVSTVDSEGQSRLRKVARLCEGYGRRVQNSVFELTLERHQLRSLRSKLELVISASDDSIIIYMIECGNILELGVSDRGDATGYTW